MNSFFKHILILSWFLFSGLVAYSQNWSVSARTLENKVWIRWHCSDQAATKEAIKSGFIIKRTTIKHGDSILNNDETFILSKDVVKTATDSNWQEAVRMRPDWEITYQWLKPADSLDYDLGAQIKQRRTSQLNFLLASIQMYQNFQAAQYAGLGFEDNKADPDKVYLYSVYQNGINPVLLGSATNLQLTERPEPPVLNEINPFINLFCNTELNRFTGYLIERRTSISDSFTRITQVPLLSVSQHGIQGIFFTDSIISPGEIQYRMIGIDEFGLLSRPSDILTVKIPVIFPPIRINGTPDDETGKLLLKTDFPDSLLIHSPVFRIYTADSLFGDYVLLKDSIFNPSDLLVRFQNSCYARVDIVTTEGQQVAGTPHYIHVSDSTAPEIPLIISGNINKNGLLTITWKRNNYREKVYFNVYHSNNRKHEFGLLNSVYINDTLFSDSINLNFMRDSLFVAISALDAFYNESKKAVIAIPVPDIIPPATPVFTDFQISDSAIKIHWECASSDVTKYYIKRKTINNDSTLFILDANSCKHGLLFDDSTFISGMTYQYSISCSDEADNNSPFSSPLSISAPDKWRNIKNINPQLIEYKEKNQILLLWDWDENIHISHFRILRKTEAKAPVTVEVVSPESRQYLIRNHPKEGKTVYYIKPCTNNGL